MTIAPGGGPVFNNADMLVAAAMGWLGSAVSWKTLLHTDCRWALHPPARSWCAPLPGYHLFHLNREGTTRFELLKRAVGHAGDKPMPSSLDILYGA